MPLFPRRRFSNIQLSCKDPLLPLHFAMFRSTTLDIRASGLGKVGYLGYTGSVQLPSDMSLLTPSWIDRLLTKKVWLSYTSLYRYIISRKREQEQDSATSQVTRSGCQTARSSAIHPSVIYPSPSAAAFFVSSRKNVIKKTPRNRLSPSQKLKPSRLLPWTRSHLKAKWGKFPTPPISTRCDPSSLDNSYEEKDEFFRSFLFFSPSLSRIGRIRRFCKMHHVFQSKHAQTPSLRRTKRSIAANHNQKHQIIDGLPSRVTTAWASSACEDWA
jgi:hypothetical protein